MKKYLSLFFIFFLAGCSILPISSQPAPEQPEEPITPTVASEEFHYNYYYALLDNEGKSVYNTMYDAVANFSDEVDFSGVDYETFLQAQMAFNYDHPEYYWINEFECTTTLGRVTNAHYIHDFSQEEYEECEQIASDILANVDANASTYEKLKYIYEYIINTTDYDINASFNQDIRSVLKYQSSVCAGYARTYQYLCNLLEIPSIYVTGTGKNGESHSWNEVLIDENWYWVDVTWGDPVFDNEDGMDNYLNYNYFCVSDRDFLDTHSISTGFELSNYSCKDLYSYPSCTSDDYNYYILEGCYFDAYDRYQIDDYIGTLLENGYTRSIELKFSNEDSFYEAYNDLFSNGEQDGYIFEIIKDHCYFVHTMKYEVHYSETMYYLSIDIYIA